MRSQAFGKAANDLQKDYLGLWRTLNIFVLKTKTDRTTESDGKHKNMDKTLLYIKPQTPAHNSAKRGQAQVLQAGRVSVCPTSVSHL